MDSSLRDDEIRREDEHRQQQRTLQEQALAIARRSNLTKLLSSIVGALGLIAAGITVVVGLGSFSVRAAVEEIASKYLDEALTATTEDFEGTVASLHADIDTLSKQLEALSTISDESQLMAEITAVAQETDSLNTRLGAIEQAILDNPEKALGLPLLRNEVEGVKTAYALEIAALRAEVARIYDLNKWFVGLMFTMALGIIGLAVSNFLKPAKGEEK